MAKIEDIIDEIIDLKIMLLGADEEETLYIKDRINELEKERDKILRGTK